MGGGVKKNENEKKMLLYKIITEWWSNTLL